jgi:hypothetical protein
MNEETINVLAFSLAVISFIPHSQFVMGRFGVNSSFSGLSLVYIFPLIGSGETSNGKFYNIAGIPFGKPLGYIKACFR